MTREEFLVRRSIAVKLPPGAAKGSTPVHRGVGKRNRKVDFTACVVSTDVHSAMGRKLAAVKVQR